MASNITLTTRPPFKWIFIQDGFDSLDIANKTNLIILCVVFIVGVLGNSSVIFTFLMNGTRRSHFESRLVLLAVIDLLSSSFIPTLFIYAILTKFKVPHFTATACKVWISLYPLSVSISQGILMFITYERYLRIRRPFNEPLKIRLWFMLIVIISFGLVSPYTYTLGNQCKIKSLLMHQAYTCLNMFRNTTAVVSMVYFNCKIVVLLKKKKDVYLNVTRHLPSRVNTVYKTLLKMVCMFTVLVIPVDIFQFTVLVMRLWSPYNVITVNTFLVTLQMSNSVANVIIYSVTDQNFRTKFIRGMKRITRRLSRCQQS